MLIKLIELLIFINICILMNVCGLNFTKVLVLHDKFTTMVKLTNQVQYRNLVSKKASAFFLYDYISLLRDTLDTLFRATKRSSILGSCAWCIEEYTEYRMKIISFI